MDKKLLIYPLLFSAGLLQAQQKPNVVIIFTDDQGYQDLGNPDQIGRAHV